MTFLTNPPAVLIKVYESSDIQEALKSIYENLASTIEVFQQRGSGWVLDKLLALDLHLLEFDPLRTTSYILLPTCIQNGRAVIDIKNKDEKCLLLPVYISKMYSCVTHKVHLITWNTRRNLTFKAFHSQWVYRIFQS